MADSVEYLALVAMKARLAQITTANGFETDVAKVELVDSWPDQIREYPAIMFQPFGTQRPDDAALRRIFQSVDLDLAVVLETPDDATRKLSNAIADIEKALTTDASGNLDTTLGGTVNDLHVRGDERFQLDDGSDPRAIAVVRVELIVRHRAGDPYTQS